MTFLFYVTYHSISKARGNETNKSMNTLAILISCIGLVAYSIYFFERTWYWLWQDKDKYYRLHRNHRTLYSWKSWLKYASILLFHMLFALSYVRTMLKLRPLIQITKIFGEMIEQTIERMKKLEPPMTPKELEDYHQKINKNKEMLVKQENWWKGISFTLVIGVLVTFYPFIYLKTRLVTCFFDPMFFFCAVSILISALVMRCVIKDAPNM